MMVDSMNAGGIMSLAAMANKDITGEAQQGHGQSRMAPNKTGNE